MSPDAQTTASIFACVTDPDADLPLLVPPPAPDATLESLTDEAITRYDMLGDGDHVLMAVSGGKDSLTCLDQLVRLRDEGVLDITISAANVKTDFHCRGCVHHEVLAGRAVRG